MEGAVARVPNGSCERAGLGTASIRGTRSAFGCGPCGSGHPSVVDAGYMARRGRVSSGARGQARRTCGGGCRPPNAGRVRCCAGSRGGPHRGCGGHRACFGSGCESGRGRTPRACQRVPPGGVCGWRSASGFAAVPRLCRWRSPRGRRRVGGRPRAARARRSVAHGQGGDWLGVGASSP